MTKSELEEEVLRLRGALRDMQEIVTDLLSDEENDTEELDVKEDE